MADRYGDDMQFNKMMEASNGKGSVAGSTSNNAPLRKKKLVKIPVGCTPKELDKNCWEYWEKRRVSMRSILVAVDEEEIKDGNNCSTNDESKPSRK